LDDSDHRRAKHWTLNKVIPSNYFQLAIG